MLPASQEPTATRPLRLPSGVVNPTSKAPPKATSSASGVTTPAATPISPRSVGCLGGLGCARGHAGAARFAAGAEGGGQLGLGALDASPQGGAFNACAKL